MRLWVWYVPAEILEDWPELLVMTRKMSQCVLWSATNLRKSWRRKTQQFKIVTWDCLLIDSSADVRIPDRTLHLKQKKTCVAAWAHYILSPNWSNQASDVLFILNGSTNVYGGNKFNKSSVKHCKRLGSKRRPRLLITSYFCLCNYVLIVSNAISPFSFMPFTLDRCES